MSTFRAFGRTVAGLSKGSAVLCLPIIATSAFLINRGGKPTHNAGSEAFYQSAPIGPSIRRIIVSRNIGMGGRTRSVIGSSASSSGQDVSCEAMSPDRPMFEGVLLHDKDGNEIDPASLKGKSVGLYFAASWCPACRFMGPKLKQWYDRVNAETNGAIEIVLISSDMDARAESVHMSSYSWLSMPVNHAATRAIKRRYRCWALRENAELSEDGVKRESGIPTVVVVGPHGEALERIRLEEDGPSGLERWRYNDWKW